MFVIVIVAFSVFNFVYVHQHTKSDSQTLRQYEDQLRSQFIQKLNGRKKNMNHSVTATKNIIHHPNQQAVKGLQKTTPKKDTTQASTSEHQHHQQKDRKIYTIFSTACSKSQDWQSQVLIDSHLRQKVPGEIIRLMSCNDDNYQLPHHSHHPNYRVVRTPDFNQLYLPDNDYSPRNRPMSVYHWLNGQTSDTNDLPRDNDVIVAVDPDQIFASGVIRTDHVHFGHGVAARYGIGTEFLQKWNHYCWNATACQPSKDYHPSFGHPLLLTARDAKRHARHWSNVTNDMRREHTGWETEMFSNVISLRNLQIDMKVELLMISDVLDSSEPWNAVSSQSDQIPLLPPTSSSMFVYHYCQIYELKESNFVWTKHYMNTIDLQQCSTILTSLPQPNSRTTLALLKEHRLRKDLNWKKKGDDDLYKARTVWMYDHVYTRVIQALWSYHELYCKGSSEETDQEKMITALIQTQFRQAFPTLVI